MLVTGRGNNQSGTYFFRNLTKKVDKGNFSGGGHKEIRKFLRLAAWKMSTSLVNNTLVAIVCDRPELNNIAYSGRVRSTYRDPRGNVCGSYSVG